MADQLVADVWLGSVERLGRVPDVLGGVEDPECKSGQEIAGRQEPGNRTESKSGRGCKEKIIFYQICYQFNAIIFD